MEWQSQIIPSTYGNLFYGSRLSSRRLWPFLSMDRHSHREKVRLNANFCTDQASKKQFKRAPKMKLTTSLTRSCSAWLSFTRSPDGPKKLLLLQSFCWLNPFLVLLLYSLYGTSLVHLQRKKLSIARTRERTITNNARGPWKRRLNWGVACRFIDAKLAFLDDIYFVTEIGKWAFLWCSSLMSVILPDSATLGDAVFYECDALLQKTAK